MCSAPPLGPAFLAPVCDFNLSSFHFHTYSLAGKEAANTPGSPKIEHVAFMESLCRSEASRAHFMLEGHVWVVELSDTARSTYHHKGGLWEGADYIFSK